jgi:Mn-dependent DtxR family transcriptional regulator
MHKLTEFEKSLLLAFLALSKGSKFVRKEEVLIKLPRYHRKMADRMIERLAANGYLLRHVSGKSFTLSEKGRKEAMRALVAGGKLI